MKTLAILLMLLIVQPQEIITARRRASSASGCAAVPTPSVDFISTTLGTSGSNITTWADSSGHSNTATWTANFPTVDTTNTTPNSTKTGAFPGTGGVGTLASTLTNSSSVTVCAVYEITNVSSTYATFTGNAVANALSYLSNNSGSVPQLFYNGGVIAQATNTPLALTWSTSCGVITIGTGASFWLWNGTSSGTDATSSFNASATVANGINNVFGGGGLGGIQGNAARLTIWNSALTSTNITNYHSCQVTTFGVP